MISIDRYSSTDASSSDPNLALVGVDTEALRPDGTRFHCAKVLPLCHLNALLAGRGTAGVIAFCYQMATIFGSDFDDLIEAMPGMLKGVDKLKRELGTPLRLTKEAVALVGWSPRDSRVRGYVFTQEAPCAEFTAEEVHKYYFAPMEASIQHHATFNNPAELATLAQAQVRLLTEKAPEAAAGGRLIVVSLTRDGMVSDSSRELSGLPQKKVSGRILTQNHGIRCT